MRINRILVMGVVALAIASPSAVIVSHAPATAAARQQDPTALRLVSSPLTLNVPGLFTVVVRADAPLAPDSSIVVRSHTPILSRAEMSTVLSGVQPPQVDNLRIDPTAVSVDAQGQISISIPIELETRTKEALRLTGPGVQAIEISIEDATERTLSTITVFAELPAIAIGGSNTTPPLPVAVITAISGMAPMQPDGSTSVDGESRDAVQNLVDLLDTSTVPISVSLRPSVIAALASTDGVVADQQLIERLNTTMAQDGDELLAATTVDIEPSAAARAAQTTQFIASLRTAQDQLADSLPDVEFIDSIWLQRDGIDRAGQQLLRDVGIRFVIGDASSLASSPTVGRTGVIGRTDLDGTARLLVMPTDAPLRAGLAATLREADDLELRVHQMMADLLALRWEVATDAAFGTKVRRGVVVSLGAPGEVAPAVFERFATELLAHPDLVAPVLASTLLEAADRNTSDAQVRPVRFASAPEFDIGLDVLRRAELLERATSVLGMRTGGVDGTSPLGADQLDDWTNRLSVVVDRSMSGERRGEFFAELDTELTSLRRSVSLGGSGDVTVGGRTSTVPITLTNSSDEPLTVVIRLSSPKLLFPEGANRVVENLAGTNTIEIPVEVRTNGTFPVTVQLFTPDGRVALTSPREFSVNSSALTGLGQVVTGAFIVVLASWWVQHARKSRRSRLTDRTRARHPLSGGGPDEPLDHSNDETLGIPFDPASLPPS